MWLRARPCWLLVGGLLVAALAPALAQGHRVTMRPAESALIFPVCSNDSHICAGKGHVAGTSAGFLGPHCEAPVTSAHPLELGPWAERDEPLGLIVHVGSNGVLQPDGTCPQPKGAHADGPLSDVIVARVTGTDPARPTFSVTESTSAQTAPSNRKQVTLCHRTGSRTKPYTKITVTESAVGANLKHGDVQPDADGNCPASAAKKHVGEAGRPAVSPDAYDGGYTASYTVTQSSNPIARPGQTLVDLEFSVTNLGVSGDISGTIDADSGRISGATTVVGVTCSYSLTFTLAGSGVTVSGSATCDGGRVVGRVEGRRVSGGPSLPPPSPPPTTGGPLREVEQGRYCCLDAQVSASWDASAKSLRVTWSLPSPDLCALFVSSGSSVAATSLVTDVRTLLSEPACDVRDGTFTTFTDGERLAFERDFYVQVSFYCVTGFSNSCLGVAGTLGLRRFYSQPVKVTVPPTRTAPRSVCCVDAIRSATYDAAAKRLDYGLSLPGAKVCFKETYLGDAPDAGGVVDYAAASGQRFVTKSCDTGKASSWYVELAADRDFYVQVVFECTAQTASGESPPAGDCRGADSGGLVYSNAVKVSISGESEDFSGVDFDWETPARYKSGAPPPDPSPPGFEVAFRLQCTGLVGVWRWLVNGRRVEMTRGRLPGTFASEVGGCFYHYRFPREGAYEVSFAVERDGREVFRRTHAVAVQDWLIVGVGDSVASGEGNRPPGGWDEQRCHRSRYSFESLVAAAVEAHDRKTSVTFVHLACSGASIGAGLVGPYSGIEPSAGVLPPQLTEARRLVGNREIDALVVSIGANDIGFGSIVEFCAEQPSCYSQRPGGGGLTLDRVVGGRLAALPGRFERLRSAVRGLVGDSGRVYVTEYFDPTRNEKGEFCTRFLHIPPKAEGISKDEAAWAYGKVVRGLNAAVAATGTGGWRFIGGIQKGFRRHGYCSKGSWIVGVASILSQGDKAGILHPDRDGHQFIASRVLDPLQRDLYPGGQARPPR